VKVFIGIPSRRETNVEALRYIVRWPRDSKHQVTFEIEPVYGIDAARSILIERAKEWGAELFCMADTDAVPRLTFKDTISLVRQAFSRGYAMMMSPTARFDHVTRTSSPMVFSLGDKHAFEHPFSKEPFVKPIPFSDYNKPPTDGPFEIDWGALGLAFIDGAALPKLAVLSEQHAINGPPVKLYCTYTPTVGEDASLCRNVRASTGKKVGSDARIRVDHLKMLPIPSYHK
jgi:hypothetical protein